MIEGKTKSGFKFAITEESLDNMELLEWLIEVDRGEVTHLTDALNVILGKEQKAALYNHCRLDNGRVPTTAVMACVQEILQAAGDTVKN